MSTLPTDSAERKEYPLFRGLLRYFPAALAGVARHSKRGNDKHNPGEEMHHARGKSSDHADCIVRHLVDLADMLAAIDRGDFSAGDQPRLLLAEADALVWRACALSQELYETHVGAPLAPGARLADPRERLVPVAGPIAKSVKCNALFRTLDSITSCSLHAGHEGAHAYT